MELLQSLGVNQTVFFQFLIFAIAFFSMMEIAFKPFAKAAQSREDNTKGSIENTGKLQEQKEVLLQQYEAEARKLTSEIKTIFDRNRDQARGEADKTVGNARQESALLIQQTREKVQSQLGEATRKAQDDIPALAQAMVKKLLA